MAYNDSGELPVSQSTYSLGVYTFELKVQTVHEPGEPDVVSVFAICRGPDGSRETQAVDFPAGTTVESWSVEANETEASVYVVHEYESSVDISPFTVPINCAESGIIILANSQEYTIEAPAVTMVRKSNTNVLFIVASATNGTYKPPIGTSARFNRQATFNGRTVYYDSSNLATTLPGGIIFYSPSNGEAENWNNKDAQIAWTMIYGNVESGSEEEIVGRFAIDIREADGGPDGDWDEPGDTGDPVKTLYVGVVGATAGQPGGRLPIEPETATIYGSGGTGGNGGGGGAGASTVIIYDFATDKAGSVVQTASSKGPSGRSSGGNGGRGADGCILIFY